MGDRGPTTIVSLLSLTVTVFVAHTNLIFIEALPQVNKSSPTIILQCVTANFYPVDYVFIVSRKRCVYKYASLYPANRQHKQDLTPTPLYSHDMYPLFHDARSNIHIILYNKYKHKLSPYNNISNPSFPSSPLCPVSHPSLISPHPSLLSPLPPPHFLSLPTSTCALVTSVKVNHPQLAPFPSASIPPHFCSLPTSTCALVTSVKVNHPQLAPAWWLVFSLNQILFVL